MNPLYTEAIVWAKEEYRKAHTILTQMNETTPDEDWSKAARKLAVINAVILLLNGQQA